MYEILSYYSLLNLLSPIVLKRNLSVSWCKTDAWNEYCLASLFSC